MSQNTGKPLILFHMTGSIAAFKACELISSLVKGGNDVQVCATKDLFEFIGPATLEGLTGRQVLTSIYQPGHQMDHIHLAREATYHILCPATANTVNKMAAGISDNLPLAILLANNFQRTVFIVPAMNQSMHAHPATQESLKKLESWGAQIISGEPGSLACGEWGVGRMAEPAEVINWIAEARQ